MKIFKLSEGAYNSLVQIGSGLEGKDGYSDLHLTILSAKGLVCFGDRPDVVYITKKGEAALLVLDETDTESRLLAI